MKKLISLLLALMMVLSLATVSFAADRNETITNGEAITNGSITINTVAANTTYSIYKLLHLDTYDTVEKAYNYYVSEGWENFFDTDEAKQYFTKTSNDYVSWSAATDDATVAAFAKAALAYAKANDIDPVNSITTTNQTSIVFSNLTLGYYLVDSTMGALCGLTTTNPHAAITAKNKVPVVDKQVKEDSTNTWGASNTADIGQTVEFRAIIDVHAGAENYAFHDEMSDGLTYKGVTKIEHVIPASGSTPTKTTTVPAEYYTVKTTETYNLNDDCDFEIVFTQAFCDHLKTNDKIIIYYEAMLNRHAVIAGEGNVNDSYLEYGEDHFTTHDKTQTYTFEFDLVKTDSQNTLIDGAQFKIYDAATGGNEVRVVPLLGADDKTPVLDDNNNPVYRRARENETVGVNIVVNDGIATVVGLDNGEYYLEEVIAPDNYEKLLGRHKFVINGANLNASFTQNPVEGGDPIYSTGSGVHVVNRKGTMLPETGATGTAMFIFFGMFVMLTTGVLLVTKKRMSMIEE